jgi:hypothetical protein
MREFDAANFELKELVAIVVESLHPMLYAMRRRGPRTSRAWFTMDNGYLNLGVEIA